MWGWLGNSNFSHDNNYYNILSFCLRVFNPGFLLMGFCFTLDDRYSNCTYSLAEFEEFCDGKKARDEKAETEDIPRQQF